jgi:diacylglycerol kinase family enzyme
MAELGAVVAELEKMGQDGKYVTYHQVPWLETHGSGDMPVNLDGEPVMFESIRFEAIPAAIRLVLPTDCPLLGNERPDRGDTGE